MVPKPVLEIHLGTCDQRVTVHSYMWSQCLPQRIEGVRSHAHFPEEETSSEKGIMFP